MFNATILILLAQSPAVVPVQGHYNRFMNCGREFERCARGCSGKTDFIYEACMRRCEQRLRRCGQRRSR